MTAEKIGEAVGLTKHAVYHAIEPSSDNLGISAEKKARVRGFIKENGLTLATKTKRYLKIEPDLMRLFGYYLAEGYATHSSQVSFSFHAKESDYHNDVIRLMDKYFGISGCLHKEKGKLVTVVTFYSSVVKNLMEKLFGRGARNKTMPEWFVDLPEEHVIQLLRGMWYGDGHVESKLHTGCRASYVTASRNLCQQVFTLLSRLDIVGQIQERTHCQSKQMKRSTWQIAVNGSATPYLMDLLGYEYDVPPRHRASHNQYWLHGNWFCGQVDEVSRCPYDGLVYNLEVADDNSYVANNVTVHNCIEAMSCGLPVITTAVGGLNEMILDNHNGIKFDPNHHRLSDVIKYVAEDEALRKRLGTNARQTVLDSYSKQRWESQWRQLIPPAEAMQ
jgi:hypothetical protein